jgi:esterase/lipase superfamily enzyme
MAHSMGNRIAKGWLDSSKPQLSQIILFAPDLSNAEFQASGFYRKYTKNLLLFYNANDRFLKWSSQLNKCARLGRSPNNDLLNTESHIQLINRSQMNDETKLGGSFSGHIYYKNSPSTIKLIRDLLY